MRHGQKANVPKHKIALDELRRRKATTSVDHGTLIDDFRKEPRFHVEHKFEEKKTSSGRRQL